MDVYKLLRQDHETVKAIFEELEETTERSLKKRQSLFPELNLELTVHTLAEEKYLYSLLKEADETHEISQEAVEEHKLAKELLKELEAGDKATEAWHAKLMVLKENFVHHVEQEEGEIFKKARKVIDSETAEQLATEIEAFKQEQIHVLET
jgi:hypothetical protein